MDTMFMAAGTVRAQSAAPVSSTSPGTAGMIAYDANYIYVCVATNTWRRALVEVF